MNNCDMTRMAHMRVQKMDPENASMIVGYYLLRDNRDRELVISLAFGPDSVFQSLVANAQLDLGLLPSSLHSHPHLAPPSNNDCSVDPMYLPSLSPHSQSHLQLELQSQLLSELQSQLQPHTPYTNLCRGAGPAWSPYPQDLPECPSLAFSKLLPFCAAEQVLGEEPDQIGLMGNNNNNNNSNYNSFSSNPFIHPDQIYAGLNYGLGGGSGISSLGDPSLDSVTSAHKPCSYYARGFCKHGTSCKFLHIPMRFDPSSPHGSSQSQGQGQSQSRSQNQTQREIYNEDGLSSGSLERLEMELQNLLRGQRSPVSIASLPQLYYERYGKTLQAEGYLTESQRHGKAGYSLTKLLARLKNTVTLIDRPHGQHAVVLAEDAQKFISFRESEDQCGINPGSRQIYLTFPAESTFSEDDVSEHFKAYGPVQDVRIPYQQKRMFGFVTFVYSETVKAILSKGNPHYICGSRVLVKPYKEKGKQIEKKIVDRGEQSRYSSKAGLEIRELEFSPGLKLYNGGDPLFRDYEEQNQALLALDRRRLQQLQLQLVMEPHSQYPQETHLHHISLSNGYNPVLSGESTRIPEDLNNLQSSSALGYLLDVLDSDTGEVQVPPRHKSNSISHSDEHNLPESPFASPPMHAAATPLSNQLKALTLASSHDSDFSRFSTISLRCIICQGLMADPIQLECTHTFCIQCILEVIGVSRDECPLCRRNIGNQIVKLLENRGFPVIIDPSRGGGS